MIPRIGLMLLLIVLTLRGSLGTAGDRESGSFAPPGRLGNRDLPAVEGHGDAGPVAQENLERRLSGDGSPCSAPTQLVGQSAALPVPHVQPGVLLEGEHQFAPDRHGGRRGPRRRLSGGGRLAFRGLRSGRRCRFGRRGRCFRPGLRPLSLYYCCACLLGKLRVFPKKKILVKNEDPASRLLTIGVRLSTYLGEADPTRLARLTGGIATDDGADNG